MFFCVCARGMHHTELQQTTHTRGSTSASVPILATEQIEHEVKGGVQEQGQQEFRIQNAAGAIQLILL